MTIVLKTMVGLLLVWSALVLGTVRQLGWGVGAVAVIHGLAPDESTNGRFRLWYDQSNSACLEDIVQDATDCYPIPTSDGFRTDGVWLPAAEGDFFFVATSRGFDRRTWVFEVATQTLHSLKTPIEGHRGRLLWDDYYTGGIYALYHAYGSVGDPNPSRKHLLYRVEAAGQRLLFAFPRQWASERYVQDAAFSPDGQTLALLISADNSFTYTGLDHRVWLLDVPTGKLAPIAFTTAVAGLVPTAVAWSDDGQTLSLAIHEYEYSALMRAGILSRHIVSGDEVYVAVEAAAEGFALPSGTFSRDGRYFFLKLSRPQAASTAIFPTHYDVDVRVLQVPVVGPDPVVMPVITTTLRDCANSHLAVTIDDDRGTTTYFQNLYVGCSAAYMVD